MQAFLFFKQCTFSFSSATYCANLSKNVTCKSIQFLSENRFIFLRRKMPSHFLWIDCLNWVLPSFTLFTHSFTEVIYNRVPFKSPSPPKTAFSLIMQFSLRNYTFLHVPNKYLHLFVKFSIFPLGFLDRFVFPKRRNHQSFQGILFCPNPALGRGKKCAS